MNRVFVACSLLVHWCRAFGPLQAHVCAISTSLDADHFSLDKRPRFRTLTKQNATAWVNLVPDSQEKQLFLQDVVRVGKSCSMLSAEGHHLQYAHSKNIIGYYLVEFDETRFIATLWSYIAAGNTAGVKEVHLYYALKHRVQNYTDGSMFLDARTSLRGNK
jgi:hypothetical protein